jgi:chromate reductase, NAD(P)H dehydrogenase (quinone)
MPANYRTKRARPLSSSMLSPLPRRTGPYQILAVSGSLRALSSNRLALEAVGSLAPPTLRVTIFSGIDALPHFNPDLDTGEARPMPVRAWRGAIARADALLVSSPEYAHGVPGALKNAFDWLVSGPEFPALLVALLNTSPRASHAQASLLETLTTMSAEILNPSIWSLPLGGRPLSLDQFLADPELVAPLQRLVDTLERAIQEGRAAARRLVAPDATTA